MASASAPVSFTRSIKPLLAERCQLCHNGGKVTLKTWADLKQRINTSDLDASLLMEVIAGDKPRMLKTGAPLTPDQVAMIRRWIAEGAKNDGSDADEVWWSLRPL